MAGSRDSPEDEEDRVSALGDASAGGGQAGRDPEAARDKALKAEEYDFEKITEAYNVLMGFNVKIKEEPPSRMAPLLKKAGIDEKKARNFMYYYKYHIIISIVLVIAVVYLSGDASTRWSRILMWHFWEGLVIWMHLKN